MTLLLEVYPVTRSVVDAQFGNAFPNGFYVAGVAGSKAFNSRLYAGPRSNIAKSIEPPHEYGRCPNLEHTYTVAERLQCVKSPALIIAGGVSLFWGLH